MNFTDNSNEDSNNTEKFKTILNMMDYSNTNKIFDMGIINNNFLNIINNIYKKNNKTSTNNLTIDDDELFNDDIPITEYNSNMQDVTYDNIPSLVDCNTLSQSDKDSGNTLSQSDKDIEKSIAFRNTRLPAIMDSCNIDTSDDDMPALVNSNTLSQSNKDSGNTLSQSDKDSCNIDTSDDDMPALVNCNTLSQSDKDSGNTRLPVDDDINLNVTNSNNKKQHGLFLIGNDECDDIKKRIPVITYNSDNIISVYERNELLKNNTGKPVPFRLTMLEMQNNCQFCFEPKGNSFCHFINFHFGFVSCNLCMEKGKNAITDWYETASFGRAHHLKDKKIKIRRSQINPITGTDIEDGWELHNPITITNEKGEYIECINSSEKLERYCLIDTILELNQ